MRCTSPGGARMRREKQKPRTVNREEARESPGRARGSEGDEAQGRAREGAVIRRGVQRVKFGQAPVQEVESAACAYLLTYDDARRRVGCRRGPRVPPGPNDRVVISGTIDQIHPTHIVLGTHGARLFFPEGASASDFKIRAGDRVTMTVVRVGARYIVEKVSHDRYSVEGLL
jgi:hypothetical protein